ncbi:MAG: hypothetical protein OEW89_12430 [Gammaproteobacteria bacterium]|nr:hypothetical protein [Gammaproteobacteria bacterium]
MSKNDEQGFKSSDPEYMNNFTKLLEKKSIPYRYSGEYVMYKYSDKDQVEEIINMLSSTISIQHVVEEVRKYFRSLLDEENIEYIAQDKDDGSWTMWWPHSKEQEEIITLKVVELYFNKVSNGTK